MLLYLSLISCITCYPHQRSLIEADNVEEISGDFEGDIILAPDTIYRGIGVKSPLARWPNGIVPYEILSEYDAYDQAKIVAAMRRLERLVSLNPHGQSFCIRFRPKTDDDNYFISIKNGSGCSSFVGRVFEGGQPVTLEMKTYCVDREATIMHEFIHALGFWHEQSRPDRDDYITIDFSNVRPGTEHNFNKYSIELTDTLNLPYDYNSVMHYSKTAFSVNGSPTIITKDPNVWIGQRNTLSANDIQEIRRYYNCI
ncbi:unnamed protein product [Adineta ricciae]|uniref:Metalloendopeptidase n=1 Tax=Adineta ricciae TaxID=249248 RepID=A0A816D4Q2_ADIRI|nr:unnamed protein product [Adineta ricciae]